VSKRWSRKEKKKVRIFLFIYFHRNLKRKIVISKYIFCEAHTFIINTKERTNHRTKKRLCLMWQTLIIPMLVQVYTYIYESSSLHMHVKRKKLLSIVADLIHLNYFSNIHKCVDAKYFLFKYQKQFYSTDDDVGYDFKSLFESQAGWRFLANCFTTLSSSLPPLRFDFSIVLVS